MILILLYSSLLSVIFMVDYKKNIAQTCLNGEIDRRKVQEPAYVNLLFETLRYILLRCPFKEVPSRNFSSPFKEVFPGSSSPFKEVFLPLFLLESSCAGITAVKYATVTVNTTHYVFRDYHRNLGG
jgi:hypothetical protein